MRRLKVMTLSMMHKDHSLELPQSIQKAAAPHLVLPLVNANCSTKLVFILDGGVEEEEGGGGCSTVQPPRMWGGWWGTTAPAKPTMEATAQLTNGPPRKRCLH